MTTRDVWSGNVGEWGEAFTLLHILAHPKIHNADSHGKRIDSEYSQVVAVHRVETSGKQLDFKIDRGYVVIECDGIESGKEKRSTISKAAHSLYQRMQTQTSTASHPEQELLKRMGCESLKASSYMKADITARMRDCVLNAYVTKNYSIKTTLGGKPSLANASEQSYIDYRLPDFDAEKAQKVNSIESRSTVVDRIRAVLGYCSKPEPVVRSSTFRKNLQRCYYMAPEAVGYALLYGQLNRGKQIIDSVADVINRNPMNCLPEERVEYGDAVRRYLWGVVFDMNPGSFWRAPSEVDGYLIVNNQEEVLAFQVSRQRFFEDYLMMHSCWDTPSMSRYKDLGTVWQDTDGTWYFSLCCAVRYNSREYSGPNSQAVGIDA